MADVSISIAINVDQLTAGLREASRSVEAFGRDVSNAGRGFSALQEVAVGALRKIGETAVAAGAQAVAALGQFGLDSISAASTFEASINKLAAVAGDSLTKAGFSFDDVSNKALQLGQSTQFSAQQSIEAMIELIKGGVSVQSVMTDATDATLALAAAADLGLANAAGIVAKQLGVWGETGVNAAQVADLLASAANASTVDVEELALGLANAGGSAKVAGLSFEELVQTMALIAPNFSSAADAGTSLKTFIARLSPQTDAATRAMQELGLATKDGSSVFFDAQGNFIGMEKAAALLHEALKGLGEEQKLVALNTIFGSDAIRAAAAIAAAGAEGYNAMGQAMRDSGGAAAAAAAMQRGHAFAVEQLKGSLETLQIVIGAALLPLLTQWTDRLTAGVNVITQFAQSTLSAPDPLAALAQALGMSGAEADQFRAFVEQAMTGAQQAIMTAQQVFASALAAIAAFWAAHGATITASAQSAWGAIQAFIDAAATAVRALVTTALRAIGAFWQRHGDEIVAFAVEAWTRIANIVQTIARILTTIVQQATTAIAQFWSQHGNQIMSIASTAWSTISNLIRAALALIDGILKSALAAIQGDWRGAWDALVAAVRDAAPAAAAAVKGVMEMAAGVLRGYVDVVREIGSSIVDGIAAGVVDAARGLAEATIAAVRGAIDAAQQALRIKSPSEVAARAIGAPLAQGIATGISDELTTLQRAGAQAAQAAQTGATTAVTTVNVGGITVHAAPHMREETLARRIRAEVDAMARQGLVMNRVKR